jgi:hypothetical protein
MHYNVCNSWGASLIMEQFGFQADVIDNIFAFKGLNHSIKSSTICQLVMIHAKCILVWWASKPIKVNKWYFTSFVQNVASMEIVPLCKHELTLHWCLDVCGEWDFNPINFVNFLKIKYKFWMMQNPRLN